MDDANTYVVVVQQVLVRFELLLLVGQPVQHFADLDYPAIRSKRGQTSCTDGSQQEQAEEEIEVDAASRRSLKKTAGRIEKATEKKINDKLVSEKGIGASRCLFCLAMRQSSNLQTAQRETA